MNRITVHTDGASRGNPGAASIAYVIDGFEAGKLTYKEAIGKFTNNQAEYRAIVAAVEKLLALKPRASQIDFFADSELMVRQVIGQYKVKDANLKSIFSSLQTKLSELEMLDNVLSFTAVRREHNNEADRLANEALDQA